ncbi:hypothetical protein LCGC14_1938530 [marine sediment metagenome]|uniref:HTH luxR-type domain-containing protein n=1 Tax=marine sediment metagenome TaxID=412755 RepID=A0A0F9G9G4_9ZZZZ
MSSAKDSHPARVTGQRRSIWDLTPRELEVLHVLELDRRTIASRLGMSPGTLSQHINNIFDKLGIEDPGPGVNGAGRDRALQVAKERGLL